MPGATETNRGPDVVPEGRVIVIDVLFQDPTVAVVPLSNTRLFPCEDPNPEPEITTWLPIGPVVAERLDITGAALAVVLTDTLSNVTVSVFVVLVLLTASPMSTV